MRILPCLSLLPLLGCSGDAVELGGVNTSGEVTAYEVLTWTEPQSLLAGQQVEFFVQVRDQLGRPIPDLQQSHDRMIHSLFVSQDLEAFQHVHHEDFYEVTVDDLRESTFHFPITFPAAGRTLAIFDYAHRNRFQQSLTWLDIGGSPAQLDAPAPDTLTERQMGDVRVALTWDSPPIVGQQSSWTLYLTTPGGEDITDLVQWLGADGHAALVSADLSFVSHTHAWVPGMENMSPGMEMPQTYPGPELTFRYTFTQPGPHKMWLQFARSIAPEAPITVPFWFEVEP